ncbi:MAG TPA: glycosyltransferase family 39 protein [Acidobacteriaceae bacterium]|nr:glycosyltransferase family 39 protein [Acidobacteriaceae bacterium]
MDDAVIHTLGPGSLAWRVFDLLLIAVGVAAMIAIARPKDWFAGLFAGIVLGLVHGRDGIFDMGQRDFVIAVLLLAAYAALFRATRKTSPNWMLIFGLCAGMAAAIKPPFLLLAPAIMVVLFIARRADRRASAAFILYAAAGFALPLIAIFLWLWRAHALHSLLLVIFSLVRYHVSLAHRSLGYLLLHSISPLLPLVLLWLFLALSQREDWSGWERRALIVAVAIGLFSWLVQAKGYPYQRYPFLAFLLLIMGMDFSVAARKSGLPRLIGVAGLAFGVLFLAPTSAWTASRYDWRNTDFLTSLQHDLDRLGGQRLSGRIQCIDTTRGCYNALYDSRLIQSTGFLYDEFLFGPERDGVVAASRKAFWNSVQSHPPIVFVVVGDLFPAGPPGFAKLAFWPQFDAYLQTHYFVYHEVDLSPAHWWSRPELHHSYRIYLIRTPSSPAIIQSASQH